MSAAPIVLMFAHVVVPDAARRSRPRSSRPQKGSVGADGTRIVVEFVDARNANAVTQVTDKAPLNLARARKQRDLLHITSIGVISPGGEVVPIVGRAIEDDSSAGEVVPLPSSSTIRHRLGYRPQDDLIHV